MIYFISNLQKLTKNFPPVIVDKHKTQDYILHVKSKFQRHENTHRLREPLRREVCFLLTVAHTNKSENKNKHLSFLESPPFCKKTVQDTTINTKLNVWKYV